MTQRRRSPGSRKGGRVPSTKGVRYAVRVGVDGRRLELKEFLHDVIGGAVDGMLDGLREVNRPRKIRLEITRL